MIATFGDNEFYSTVEYCGESVEKHMHKVTYHRPKTKPFENYIFNEDRDAGEIDAINMAKEFVNQRKKQYGK